MGSLVDPRRLRPFEPTGDPLAQDEESGFCPTADELAALIDLGMWTDQIAAYLGLEPEEVIALRAAYRL